MGVSANLVSIPTLVESPFIIAEIGGIEFGSFTSAGSSAYGLLSDAIYPNFMKSMTINKVNGTVNTYSINFTYQVQFGDDPNLLDKIFSKATKDRKIILKYGDWSAPEYIYKEEKCIITNITSNLNMNNASIDYTLNCTSDAIGLASTPFNFPSREAKPSDVLLELLSSPKYGLKHVFTGMGDKTQVLNNNLIASNDKKVKLEAQTGVTPIAYMNYLVDSMVNNTNNNSNGINNSKYYLTIHDDYTNNLGGTYFKVTEVNKNTKTLNSTETYEVDVNYPGDNFVTQFSLNNDQSWAILYEYNQAIKRDEYSYSITDEGKVETTYSPILMKSANGGLSAAKSEWWTKMTQFPIKATLTIKGLTRPSVLMTYVKVNVLFNGSVKHISSGLYIITKQTDTIDASGYKTTLELLRVGGDE